MTFGNFLLRLSQPVWLSFELNSDDFLAQPVKLSFVPVGKLMPSVDLFMQLENRQKNKLNCKSWKQSITIRSWTFKYQTRLTFGTIQFSFKNIYWSFNVICNDFPVCTIQKRSCYCTNRKIITNYIEWMTFVLDRTLGIT